jgi:heme o synthase
MKANLVVAPPGQASAFIDYLALMKFRLLLLVLISVCMGFFIGANEQTSFFSLLWVLVGVYCVGGGANTLNQWIERDIDILMVRTQKRPLPSKRISPNNALLFGLAISLVGCRPGKFAYLDFKFSLLVKLPVYLYPYKKKI